MHTNFLLFEENGFKKRQGEDGMGAIYSSIDQTAFVSLDKANHTKYFLL